MKFQHIFDEISYNIHILIFMLSVFIEVFGRQGVIPAAKTLPGQRKVTGELP